MQFLRNLSAGFSRQPAQNGHVPFWQGMNRNYPKFLVMLELGYVQRLTVGVTAPHEDAATSIVRRALDAGTLWKDSESMPILQHGFEPARAERLIQGMSVHEVDDMPAADPSVAMMRCYDASLTLLTFARQVLEECERHQDLDDPVSDTFTVELATDDIHKLAKLVKTLDDC